MRAPQDNGIELMEAEQCCCGERSYDAFEDLRDSFPSPSPLTADLEEQHCVQSISVTINGRAFVILQ